MKKVLIIGSNGMLGKQVANKLTSLGIYDVYKSIRENMDICNEEQVLNVITNISPDFVINCVAYTNVEESETNQTLAFNVNGHAVLNIAKACNKVGATLVHISTDYVFDGKLDLTQVYTEQDTTNPLNIYGKSKLMGEENVKVAHKYYILRTSWLFGDGKNFVRTMLNLSKTRTELNVVSDQYGTPTSVETLADIIEHIISKEPEFGIYHATNDGYTSWYEFAKEIFEIANIQMIVNPVKTEEYPAKAIRPKNSKLSREKLNRIGIYPESYKCALKRFVEKELQNF